jgi:hypothetical protein
MALPDITDYFSLASASLVAVASTTGDTKQHVAAAHRGKYESGVNATSGIWRNPSVTYQVIADMTLTVMLGKGFSGASGRSGYMITSVEIVTQIGQFPTVTVSAVANEGANAVNNYTVNANKFKVSVAIKARSKAQNLMTALSGGGQLQRLTLVATCDPVVCVLGAMPCASDIVNGRYELSAETLAASGENAPTATSSGGFTIIGTPKTVRDGDFVRYEVEARKEMT